MSSSGLIYLFYGIAFLIILFGFAAMGTRHILRSAMYLMAVLFLSAGIYLILGAEFLAGAQILIYVGGIIVLLVFAVMLTRSQDLIVDQPLLKQKLLGAATAGTFFIVSAVLIYNSPLAVEKDLPNQVASISLLGKSFVDTGSHGYVFPFEVISFLLLGVLIGGSVIARKEK